MTLDRTVLIPAVVGAALMVLTAAPASAHCDALDGPVVKAARVALDRGDVNLVLIWVRKVDEQEVRDAFDRTRRVRGLGADAGELADRYFFETLVRVHRAGEGAPYTGLKPAGLDPGPAIRASDAAVETRSADALVTLVLRAAEHGLRDHFAEVERTRTDNVRDLDGGRRHVQAYVEFVHYVERLYKATQRPAHGHFTEPPHE